MGISSSCFNGSFCSVDDKMYEYIFVPPKREYYDKTYHDLKMIPSSNGNQISIFECITDEKNKWIIYCHGNGTDLINSHPYLSYLSKELRANVIGIDYQGYGLSDGIPSEKNCYADLEHTVNYVKEKGIPIENIILIGQSLGTGIVIDYVSKHTWLTPIILISPYKSIVKIVYDSSFVRPIDKFRSASKMCNVKCPAQIFHGKNDELIDIYHGQKIWSLLKDKRFKPMWMANVGHNDINDMISIDDISKVVYYDKKS